ncbi:MAG TPA: YgcG family protein [Pseudoduganella sp.]
MKALARCLSAGMLWGAMLLAQAQLAVPPLNSPVIDLTATLSRDQIAELAQLLSSFESKKGSQIVVLLVPTTAPETIEQYALRVAEQWKPGRKKIDDGALLLVAKQDRTMRIEVGYGLEGALNDASSKRIIAEVITPRFKEGDFYGGVRAGVDSMMRVIDGEALPAPPGRGGQAEGDLGRLLPVLFVLVIFAGSLLRAILGRVAGALVTGAGAALVAWALAGALSVAVLAGILAMLFTMFGGGMSRHWGGYGHHGYGGHGGFGGGGGRFGGGGASGRW